MSFFARSGPTEGLARASDLPDSLNKSIINVPSSEMLHSHKITDGVSSVDARATTNWYDGLQMCVQMSATMIGAG